MLKVYGDVYSGNCYKVKLLLTQLERPFQWVALDILKGQTQTPEFLAKNRNGKIPLLEIEPGVYLSESNAILHFLAADSEFLPRANPLEHAQVLQWLFFEQYSVEPYLATARFIMRYLGAPESKRKTLEAKYEPGYRALDVMERHLNNRRFFVGECYSIADIALYAYTHVAHEGDFDLSGYAAIRDWLKRVRAQPNYIAIG